MAKKHKDIAGPRLPPIAGQYMQRMGEGEMAQLPQGATIKAWPKAQDNRRGITNSFRHDAELVSGIQENLQWDELCGFFHGAK